MVDFKNLISYISILIILVSLIVILLNIQGLTGRVTDTAIVNITVESAASINFTTDSIDFGNGTVSPGEPNATLDTLGNVSGGTWVNISGGLFLENIGNINVSLQLYSSQSAADFIGGTNPGYKYNFTSRDTETGSCANITDLNFTLSTWYDFNSTDPGDLVCEVFGYADGNDSIRIDLELVIPSDSKSGNLTDNIIATATAR